MLPVSVGPRDCALRRLMSAPRRLPLIARHFMLVPCRLVFSHRRPLPALPPSLAPRTPASKFNRCLL